MAQYEHRGEGRRRAASPDMSATLSRLTELDTLALRQEWRRLYRSNPPQRIKRDLLLLAVAWKLQEQALGGLSARTRRKLAQYACDLENGGNLRSSSAVRLKPGVRLIREWHGRTYQVIVLEDGFSWNGTTHQSLSAIARQITGTAWSGPRFFGLQRKTTADEERASTHG